MKRQSDARKLRRAWNRIGIRRLKKKGPKVHGLHKEWGKEIVFRRWHPNSPFAQAFALRQAEKIMSYRWDYTLFDHEGEPTGLLASDTGDTVSMSDYKKAQMIVTANEYSGRPGDLITDLGGEIPDELRSQL